MQRSQRKPRHRTRTQTRSQAREEGAVMLVVMLILLTATALAGISLQATQYELRAAGYNRSAIQTQYVSEAAMTTTLSWVDATSLDRSIMLHIDMWNANTLAPNLSQFGEPGANPNTRQDSNRTQWIQQARLTDVTLPPITTPGVVLNDTVGTFGPRVALHPGNKSPDVNNPAVSDYVVDMYDCRRLIGTGTPGSQVNQAGSGTIKEIQLACVVTARGRSFVPNGGTKTWTTGDGTTYSAERFSLAHDTRGTIVSPPIIVQ
jgi:hypothetical protein